MAIRSREMCATYVGLEYGIAPNALCRCGSERVAGTLNAWLTIQDRGESKEEISVTANS